MSYLGQHFLKNRTKIKKIVKALEIEKGDLIIEIGPGHGEITKHLIANCQNCQIIAIEKDPKLVSLLKMEHRTWNTYYGTYIMEHNDPSSKIHDPSSKIPRRTSLRGRHDPSFKIIQGDALKILPSVIRNSYEAKPRKITSYTSYKIVGNIPYYITGKLLRLISEINPKPKLLVLTLQKQVAERIIAKPQMNLLAAAVQIWAKPKNITYISKNDFKPKPKIDSATIKLTTNSQLPITESQLPIYYKFIKIIFKQPRKTILNNLAEGLKISKQEINLRLKKIGLSPNSRPQDLSIDKIKKIIDN